MRNLLFFAFTLVFAIACNSSSDVEVEDAKTESSSLAKAVSFKDGLSLDTDDYTIQYPKDWKQDNSGKAKTSFILKAPQIPNGDASIESVSLMKVAMLDKSFPEFLKSTMDQYTISFPEFEIIDSAPNEFTFVSGSVENMVKYRQKFFEKNGVVYVLGYSAGLKDFSHYAKTAEEIMGSFRIKN